jgi:hypothetical protein
MRLFSFYSGNNQPYTLVQNFNIGNFFANELKTSINYSVRRPIIIK